jgi:hypothetical protein
MKNCETKKVKFDTGFTFNLSQHINLNERNQLKLPDISADLLNSLVKEFRAAFEGISKNLYDNIEVGLDNFYGLNVKCDRIYFKFNRMSGTCDYLFPDVLKFISESKFHYDLNKKDWEVTFKHHGVFIRSKSVKDCVLGMVWYKNRELNEKIKAINGFMKEVNENRFDWGYISCC